MAALILFQDFQRLRNAVVVGLQGLGALPQPHHVCLHRLQLAIGALRARARGFAGFGHCPYTGCNLVGDRLAHGRDLIVDLAFEIGDLAGDDRELRDAAAFVAFGTRRGRQRRKLIFEPRHALGGGFAHLCLPELLGQTLRLGNELALRVAQFVDRCRKIFELGNTRRRLLELVRNCGIGRSCAARLLKSVETLFKHASLLVEARHMHDIAVRSEPVGAAQRDEAAGDARQKMAERAARYHPCAAAELRTTSARQWLTSERLAVSRLSPARHSRVCSRWSSRSRPWAAAAGFASSFFGHCSPLFTSVAFTSVALRSIVACGRFCAAGSAGRLVILARAFGLGRHGSGGLRFFLRSTRGLRATGASGAPASSTKSRDIRAVDRQWDFAANRVTRASISSEFGTAATCKLLGEMGPRRLATAGERQK